MDDPRRAADAELHELVGQVRAVLDEVRAHKRSAEDRGSVTLPHWFLWLVTLSLPFVLGGLGLIYSAVSTNRSRLDVLETGVTRDHISYDRRINELRSEITRQRPGNDGGGP